MEFLAIEFFLTLLAIAFAFWKPDLGAPWFQRIENALQGIANKRRLAVLLVGSAAVIMRVSFLPVLPIPQPGVHDEFSHLLAGDTFAHGRLTNPTHPMWIHFETFHEIFRPSYMSMYPPAQGLILAVGEAVLGHPFWGVWLSLGLMCAAICWMLQGWLSEGWALFGGFLAVIRFATFSYWADSYWGGAMAATGGALVLGALPRIKSAQSIRYPLLMGLGLALLANTRPFEGLLFSIPIAIALFAWMLSDQRPSFPVLFARVLLPLCIVLIMTALAMGVYFWHVTGSSTRMPYEVNRSEYAVAPYFLWQPAKFMLEYHHPEMRNFYTQWELQQYLDTRSAMGIATATLGKANIVWLFYLGPLFLLTVLVALAAAPYQLRWCQLHPSTRFLVAAAGINAVGMSVEVFFAAHKAAPATCLIIALLLIAMRYLRGWHANGRATGLAIVRTISITGVVLLTLRVAARPLHLPTEAFLAHTWCTEQEGNTRRALLLSQLEHYPGKQLVIVRYRQLHNVQEEWVYNSYDIDSAKVVWARDMGDRSNEELLAYFKERTIWMVEPDYATPRLTPYITNGRSARALAAKPASAAR